MACPQGPTYSTYWVRVPASGVGYLPRTVATQVLQLEGSKRWRVWPDPPVVRPGAHEQVGKAELPVPAAVWAATPQELTLARGDVRPPP